MNTSEIKSIYLTHPERINDLQVSLNDPTAQIFENLLFSNQEAVHNEWALDIWHAPQFIPITSISNAAKTLRQLGKFWHCVTTKHFRRAALIQEQLPKFKIHPLKMTEFASLPQAGCWMLWDTNTLLVAPQRWKRYPEGKIPLLENRTAPPNRAYLKLWEAFVLLEEAPKPGEHCMDLGASPGGWTWVLQSHGAKVTAIDKAPLDARIAKLPRITFESGSAFALDPKKCGKIDWLCSDVICYPDRLFNLIERWLESGNAKNMIITIKLQGATDHAAVKKFLQLPGNVIHLDHNKHELTYVYPYRKILDGTFNHPGQNQPKSP